MEAFKMKANSKFEAIVLTQDEKDAFAKLLSEDRSVKHAFPKCVNAGCTFPDRSDEDSFSRGQASSASVPVYC